MAGEPVDLVSVSVGEIKVLSEIQNAWAGDKNSHNWLPVTAGFCQYAAPRVTGAGETAWHTAMTVAAFALLIWGMYEQVKIFLMRYGIAKEYANLASSQWARFLQRYRPLENAMLQEAMAKGFPQPDYAGAGARMSAFASWAWDAAAQRRAELAKVYRVCPDPSPSWGAGKALGLDDMVNFGYRDAEAYAKAAGDLWWNQRSELLNIGRGHSAAGARFMAAADDLLRPIAEGARTLTSGMFQTIGYMYDRNMLTFGSLFTQTPTVSEKGAEAPNPGPAAAPGSGNPM